ncbi:MAG TPA: class I SAM-dependent methyltransferase [Acidobacteriota bacterium]|nr:class I SAM-dependent methyltransferase [Acidobacteriota bacterium]
METNFHYPAEYYDEDYTTGVPNRGDIEFYSRHAAEKGSPVLELGCGTGRILIPIARSGIECNGLDMSREMLAICETKARDLGLKNVRLECASMDDFHYDRKFTLIYIPFRSFQHLLATDSQMRCLQLVREHLQDNGTFILDVFAPNIERLAQYHKRRDEWEKEFSRKNERTESTITRYFQARADLAAQIIHVEMKWEERNSTGSLVGRKEGTFDLRYFFRFELEHLLARCGFDPSLYGHFDGRPYDYVSGEMIAVCKKK